MDIPTQIKTKREAAAQARRMVDALTSDEDQKRVLAFAADLDAQAEVLERSLELPPQAPSGIVQTQTQMQMQNQQATLEKPEDEPKG
jgi:hypothetical protein